MNETALTREQTAEVDRRAVEQYGVSSLILMENAGRGVVDRIFKFGLAGPVLVCCGRGNNAGDGLVIARHLDIRHAAVEVALFAAPDDLSPDARANYDILAKTDVVIEHFGAGYDSERFAALLPESGWVVDALLGTGAKGEPRPPFDDIVDRLNTCSARKLAVDVPTGLDCDTGEAAQHTFAADHTCTFVAQKIGFQAAGAEKFTGVVHVLDIGAPRKLVDAVLAVAAEAAG